MRHPGFKLSLLLTVGFAVALAVACGPSLRRTYQSDNAFKRCFDFDYNPRKSVGQKRDCWETWLADHVYNQPADKVTYAELRLEEIADGISVPGPPGPEGEFDRRPEPPLPEPDAGTPEPAEDTPVAADEADAGVDGAPATTMPEQECEQRCKSSFTPCAEACGEPGPESCRAACDAGYRGCMRGCFGEE